MLKKAIFAGVIAFGVLFAGENIALYNEPGKLYVSIGHNMISSTAEFDNVLANRSGNGMANSKNWRCYLGSTEIIEYEFFKTAGFSDKADAARSHMQFHKFLDYSSFGVSFSSCLVSIIGLGLVVVDVAVGNDPNPTTVYVGLAVSYQTGRFL